MKEEKIDWKAIFVGLGGILVVIIVALLILTREVVK